MKRKAWAVASSLGLFGLAVVPLACFSNTDTPPPADTDSGTPAPDGGVPEDDATMPTVDAGPGPADAGPVDTGTDVAVVDAGPQPLTLTVLLSGAPEPGVNVVFQDVTGAVVTTATTDATGTVTQFVTAGSQVTAILGTTKNPNLVTIQGVAPGDALKVIDTSSSSSGSTGEDLTVTLPAPTWDAAGVGEAVYAGNCYNPIGYPLYLASYCETAGQFPLLALAVQTPSQQEIAYTYQVGNALDLDAGLPDGDTSLPLTVTRPWSTSSATATITSTNPPLLTDDAGATNTASYVNLAYDEVVGGSVFSSPQASGGTTDDAGTQSATFVMHPGYPDFVEGRAVDTYERNSIVLVAGGATRAAPQATSMAMAFDLSTLPLITTASIDSADGGTTAQPNVTWTSAGSLSAASGIFVSTQWFASLLTDAGTSYVNGTWSIVAAPTATNVRAPALPASFAAWAPPANASFNPARVGAIKASFVSDYTGFRAAFGGIPFISGYEIVVPTLPVNGTVYVVGIYPDEG
jgi:hypothetical protein